jgi:hypothetical protein
VPRQRAASAPSTRRWSYDSDRNHVADVARGRAVRLHDGGTLHHAADTQHGDPARWHGDRLAQGVAAAGVGDREGGTRHVVRGEPAGAGPVGEFRGRACDPGDAQVARSLDDRGHQALVSVHSDTTVPTSEPCSGTGWRERGGCAGPRRRRTTTGSLVATALALCLLTCALCSLTRDMPRLRATSDTPGILLRPYGHFWDGSTALGTAIMPH